MFEGDLVPMPWAIDRGRSSLFGNSAGPQAPAPLAPPVLRVGDAYSRLLRPALGFERPKDVLKDPLLDDEDKRAILSSWASNACAVENHPDLRWFIGSTGPVPLNEVLEALGRLPAPRRFGSDAVVSTLRPEPPHGLENRPMGRAMDAV